MDANPAFTALPEMVLLETVVGTFKPGIRFLSQGSHSALPETGGDVVVEEEDIVGIVGVAVGTVFPLVPTPK